MYETKPELIGIYNNGVKGGGGGGSGGSATPDGSGGLIIDIPAGIWLPVTDLGSQTSVTLSAGSAYKLDVVDSCALTAAVSSGFVGPDSYLTMTIAAGATVTLVPPLTGDIPVAGAVNECTIKYRDSHAYLCVDNG
jgi:hypothetical protein